MTVGDLKLSNQPVSYSLEPPKQRKGDNSLGIDVFKGYSLLIDFPASVVYLSPIPNNAPAMSGRPTHE